MRQVQVARLSVDVLAIPCRKEVADGGVIVGGVTDGVGAPVHRSILSGAQCHDPADFHDGSGRHIADGRLGEAVDGLGVGVLGQEQYSLNIFQQSHLSQRTSGLGDRQAGPPLDVSFTIPRCQAAQ